MNKGQHPKRDKENPKVKYYKDSRNRTDAILLGLYDLATGKGKPIKANVRGKEITAKGVVIAEGSVIPPYRGVEGGSSWYSTLNALWTVRLRFDDFSSNRLNARQIKRLRDFWINHTPLFGTVKGKKIALLVKPEK